jgi:hypothetical protein
MREKIDIHENQKAVFTTGAGDRFTVMVEDNALFVRGDDGWKQIEVTPERADSTATREPR